MSENAYFVKDTRVILLNIQHPTGHTYAEGRDNTIGNNGTVTKVIVPAENRFCNIYVRWDNGSSNCYHESNLGLLEESMMYKDE